MTATPQAESQGFLSKLGDRASNVSAILAVFGVILYAVLRIAYSIFYSPFGLQPDDLGSGYLDLLVQSAVGIFVLLLAMFLVVLLLVTLFLWSRWLLARTRAEAAEAETAKAAAATQQSGLEAATDEAAKTGGAKAEEGKADATAAEEAKAGAAEESLANPRRLLSWVLKAVGVIGLVLFAILFYGGLVVFVLHRLFRIQVPTVFLVFGYVSVAILVVGMLGLLGRAFEAIVDALSRQRGRWRDAIVAFSGYSPRRWRQATIVVASLVFVIATASLLSKAWYDRSRVLGGHAAAFTVLGFPITSWRAEDATLSWTSPSVATDLQPLAGSCALYLGQSGGTAFVYRVSAHQVLRISTLDVVVHTGPRVCNR